MSTKGAWLNVAQAAMWLADGREVEYRFRQEFAQGPNKWGPVEFKTGPDGWVPILRSDCEYRLNPEPEKPKAKAREWVLVAHPYEGNPPYIRSGPHIAGSETVRVREVLPGDE